jgi:AhpD family alkylhydroperoxidase
MEQRMNLDQVAPEAKKAMLGLEMYVRKHVPERLLALIKMRASVLNGCAYCVDMHSTDALRAGESARRLFAVAAWREAPFFSAQERAALALTDAVTAISVAGVPGEVWAAARAAFDERQVADLLMAIVTINGWNRLAISAHTQPADAAKAA